MPASLNAGCMIEDFLILLSGITGVGALVAVLAAKELSNRLSNVQNPNSMPATVFSRLFVDKLRELVPAEDALTRAGETTWYNVAERIADDVIAIVLSLSGVLCL